MKSKHIHRYAKVSGKFTFIWKCLDGCSHFIHGSQSHYLIGRASKCNQCGGIFILDEIALEEDLPRCMNCKLSIENENIVEYVEMKEGETKNCIGCGAMIVIDKLNPSLVCNACKEMYK